MNYRFLVLTVLCLGIFGTVSADAAKQSNFWEKMCASCHDGKTAMPKEAIRDKYKTAAAFGEAVRSKGDRCMNIVKNDKKMIRKVAAEIGLK